MALSNCRNNGHGLRLRYRLEVFGYASDDLCASGAAALMAVSRRSLTVHAVAVADLWSWTVGRLTAAVGSLTVVLSLSAVLTALQTS